MTRFSISILVRLFLFICCIILFTIIFNIADLETTMPSEPTITEVPTDMSTVTLESTAYTMPKLLDTPILYTDTEYIVPITHNDATNQISIINSLIVSLENACCSGLYSIAAIDEMQAELTRLMNIKAALQKDIAKFISWEAEYEYATKVWYFLRENGFSEVVSAGILGNMMVETSGGTLAIKPTVFDPTCMYYGLCQWSVIFHPDVINKSFDEQLNYLLTSIEKEFKTFGNKYYTGFTYSNFLVLATPEEAAHAFAAVYERCSASSYYKRMEAARIAYVYFMN